MNAQKTEASTVMMEFAYQVVTGVIGLTTVTMVLMRKTVVRLSCRDLAQILNKKFVSN